MLKFTSSLIAAESLFKLQLRGSKDNNNVNPVRRICNYQAKLF